MMKEIIFIKALLVVWALLPILFIQLIKNNRHKLQLKETEGILVNAKVVSWRYLSGRPPRYIVKVEYDINNERMSKTLITSGKFAVKYERERDIQVAVMPDMKKVYFAEEDWKMENIGLMIAALLFGFSFFIPIVWIIL